jgi:hypothetical protein
MKADRRQLPIGHKTPTPAFIKLTSHPHEKQAQGSHGVANPRPCALLHFTFRIFAFKPVIFAFK